MKFEINFEKKHFWMTLTAILVLTIGVIAYAYTQSIPNPGHGADTVWVNIPGATGGEMTLQQAIDSGLGGGTTYTLPIASTSVLGGIKVGNGLTIDATTGILSATGGGTINTGTGCHDISNGATASAQGTAFTSQCPNGEVMVGVIQTYWNDMCNGLCPFTIKCCKITLS